MSKRQYCRGERRATPAVASEPVTFQKRKAGYSEGDQELLAMSDGATHSKHHLAQDLIVGIGDIGIAGMVEPTTDFK